MARRYRRVTRSENEAAWRARQYTAAGPGKFRKSSKTISFRQFQQQQHGGKTIEKQIKERRQAPGYFESATHERSRRAQQTRSRNKELQELTRLRDAKIGTRDGDVINKYLATGWDSLTPEEKERFQNIFTKYPKDLVRKWLGSSEQSRRLRFNWDHGGRVAA